MTNSDKLQLKNLAFERPIQDGTNYLCFRKEGVSDPSSRLIYDGTHNGCQSYMTVVNKSDNVRFYVSLGTVVEFLKEYDLLELPDPDKEKKLVYKEVYNSWLESHLRACTGGSKYYDDMRMVFIRKGVEERGIKFTEDDYNALV